MVLAELAAGGELVAVDELRELDIAPQKPERIKGARFADGLATGFAVLHERPMAPERLLADDPQLEEARLQRALRGLRAQVDDMLDGSHGLTGLPFEVLDTYKMFAHDRGWNRSLEEAVRSGLTAEAAVERVRSEHRARLSQAPNAYLRERLHDFEDLADRLLRHLAGERPGVRALPEDAILIARNLGPAELLEYDRTHLKGLLLEEGSNASHASIVARALQIPCVGRLAGLRDRVSEGDPVIVDGDGEQAHLRPRADVLASFASRLEVRSQRRAEFARLRDTPAVTQDGVQVSLLMNAGLAVDMDTLDQTGADGIGLFRTEFQFMVAEEMPRLNAQTQLYARVLDQAGDRPVTFRTLDLGGDKVLPYMAAEREDNPAMGWRAIRMGLDRPALLRLQIRALLWAANGRPLRIMFPLIATVDEFRAARRVVDRELEWAVRRGRPAPEQLRVGAMVETPALLWHLDTLLPRVDFISVGANDLMQYMFAADRGNPRVADRYDILSPPAMRALKAIADAAAESGTPVSVCGEHAGRPLDAFALLALGFDRLSMPPAGVGPVKRMVLSTDREAARRGVDKLMLSSAGSVRGEVETLARKLNVAI
jgi:phosphotransferase system enzyme I (PtsP)